MNAKQRLQQQLVAFVNQQSDARARLSHRGRLGKSPDDYAVSLRDAYLSQIRFGIRGKSNKEWLLR